MNLVTNVFLKGLGVILPVTVTAYVLYWLGSTAEAALGPAIRLAVPARYYIAGMGVAAGVGVVLGVGILMNMWLTRRIVNLSERLLEKIPLVKTLYGSVRDLMSFFSADEKKEKMDQVVVVELADTVKLIGFLTRKDLNDLPGKFGGDERVAVYLPMSYQIGGFTLMVPQSMVSPVDMTVEEGMRFAMTAGISTKRNSGSTESAPV